MQLDFFCNSMPELLLLPQPQSKENNKKQSGAIILKQKACGTVFAESILDCEIVSPI
jgi:hypothetical protein